MFIVIRKYRVQRGMGAELAGRVREGFLPLLERMPGLRGHHLLEAGQDVLVTITMFDGADGALASSEVAAEWARDNVLEFVRGVPEIMVGDALISESGG